MYLNERRTKSVIITATFLFLCIGVQAKTQNPRNEKAGTTAEQYVLQQVQAGKPAEMAAVFKEAKDRVIHADFLKNLLTNSEDHQVHAHGIMIKDATIEGELDLINGEIPYDTFLTGCLFQNEVNLTQSRFAKSLHITDSVFMDSSDFDSATVAFDFNAKGAKFSTEAYFKSMRIEGDMVIRDARFAAEADFTGMQVNGNLIADGAQFSNTADFDNLNVKGDATFRNDNFAGYISFSEARLANFF